MGDPTREELIDALHAQFPDGEPFDYEEAIYWIANDWHGGQSSNLYAVLCQSRFKPSPIASGPEPMASIMYDYLQEFFS